MNHDRNVIRVERDQSKKKRMKKPPCKIIFCCQRCGICLISGTDELPAIQQWLTSIACTMTLWSSWRHAKHLLFLFSFFLWNRVCDFYFHCVYHWLNHKWFHADSSTNIHMEKEAVGFIRPIKCRAQDFRRMSTLKHCIRFKSD